jgi:hypothetical protein
MLSPQAACWLWRLCFLCSLLYSCTVQLIAADARVWRQPCWARPGCCNTLSCNLRARCHVGLRPAALASLHLLGWVYCWAVHLRQPPVSQSSSVAHFLRNWKLPCVGSFEHHACALVTSSAPATLSLSCAHAARVSVCLCVALPTPGCASPRALVLMHHGKRLAV